MHITREQVLAPERILQQARVPVLAAWHCVKVTGQARAAHYHTYKGGKQQCCAETPKAFAPMAGQLQLPWAASGSCLRKAKLFTSDSARQKVRAMICTLEVLMVMLCSVSASCVERVS